jgi:hypothetical protein
VITALGLVDLGKLAALDGALLEFRQREVVDVAKAFEEPVRP